MTDAAVARRTLNREAVVRAAAEFADGNGIGELTLTRVAQVLGVSLPALYNHVRSHSDCTAAVALHGMDVLAQRLQQAIGDAVGDAAVHAVAHTWRSFARERPGLYAAIHRQRWSQSPEHVAAGGHLLSLLQSVAAGYGAGVAVADDGAWALAAAMHGFVSSETEGASPVGLDPERAFAHLIAVLCSGLRAAAGPVPTSR